MSTPAQHANRWDTSAAASADTPTRDRPARKWRENLLLLSGVFLLLLAATMVVSAGLGR